MRLTEVSLLNYCVVFVVVILNQPSDAYVSGNISSVSLKT